MKTERKTERFLVECSSPLLLPREEARIRVCALVPWHPVTLSVPAEIAHQFDLERVQHGYMFYGSIDPVACSLFSDAQCSECRRSKSAALELTWPRLVGAGALEPEGAGDGLMMFVRNVSDQPARFRAVWEADRSAAPVSRVL